MKLTTQLPAASGNATRADLGFLLAKASQRWNEVLYAHFSERGYAEVRPAYGSLLLPLFEEDGLRMGELARRARLAKQTMTTMVRLLERDGLVRRETDPADGRAIRIFPPSVLLSSARRRARPARASTSWTRSLGRAARPTTCNRPEGGSDL